MTDIYREKDHKERLAKLTHFREKEKSVVADLILNNKDSGSGSGGRRANGNRSASAVTRSRSVQGCFFEKRPLKSKHSCSFEARNFFGTAKFSWLLLFQESASPERPSAPAPERGGGYHAHPAAAAAQAAGVRARRGHCAALIRQVDGGAG